MDKNYIINQSRFTEQVQYSPNGAILFSYKNNLDESTNAINSNYYKEVKNDNNYKPVSIFDGLSQINSQSSFNHLNRDDSNANIDDSPKNLVGKSINLSI